jgi:hypothetical protein
MVLSDDDLRGLWPSRLHPRLSDRTRERRCDLSGASCDAERIMLTPASSDPPLTALQEDQTMTIVAWILARIRYEAFYWMLRSQLGYRIFVRYDGETMTVWRE